MFARIRKFASSPMARRALMWLAPIVVGWIMNKLSRDDKSGESSGRRRR